MGQALKPCLSIFDGLPVLAQYEILGRIQYTRSALYPLARYINQTLAIWLKRKYKRFHHRLGRARLFLEKIARENRRLFVHWQLGDGGKLA